MTQPGYQEGNEKTWWWKVAQHLDDAQRALTNAMAHNLDDQAPVLALQDKLRESQASLLEIFRGKGLLPATNGHAVSDAAPVVETPVTIGGGNSSAVDGVDRDVVAVVSEPIVAAPSPSPETAAAAEPPLEVAR